MLIGLLAALLASAMFNYGLVLQAFDARGAPREQELSFSLLWTLLHERRWVTGLTLNVLGFPFQILALALAPFVVVLPALSVGLLLLLALGVKVLGEHVGRLEIAGVVAIIAGMGLIAWGAPDQVESVRSVASATIVLAAMVGVALAPLALRGTRFDHATFVVVASGIGFGALGISSKLIAEDLGDDDLRVVIWLAVTGLIVLVSMVTQMTAFQRRPATTVVPTIFAVQTFVPILLAPLYLDVEWNTMALSGVPLVAGLLSVLAGSVIVGHTRGVATLAAGGGS